MTFDIATRGQHGDVDRAAANDDFVAQSLTGQSIPDGESTYQFSVTVNGDTLFEADETFFVNVTNVVGATLVDGQGVGTIVNDDPEPCGYPATFIHDIQGSGATPRRPACERSKASSSATTRATGQFGGYFVQEEVADFDENAAHLRGDLRLQHGDRGERRRPRSRQGHGRRVHAA